MRSRVDPLAFAALLSTLWAAHNLADHVIQTDHQATRKTSSWSAMAGHVGSYQVTQALAVELVRASAGLQLGRWSRLAGALFSGSTHAFIDRRWPVRVTLEMTGSPKFAKMQTPIFGMYQADQALHHACLLVTALIMARRLR